MKTGKEQRQIQQKKIQSEQYLRERLSYMFPQITEEEMQRRILEIKSEPGKSKKRFLKIFYSRILFTSIIVLLQISWLCVTLTKFSRQSGILTLGFLIFSVFMALYILNKRENSVYKISWILLISIFPVLGGLLYLLCGNKNPSRGIRRKIARQQTSLMRKLPENETVLQEMSRQDGIGGIAQCMYRNSGYPVYQNTEAVYFPQGEAMLRDLLTDLRNAKQFIFLEYFIIAEGFMWKQIVDILKEKVKEGVKVRVIYDDVGCLGTLSPKFQKELKACGISCLAFNPFRPVFSLAVNNRDHRKILVIDGEIAYTGGMNLADEYVNVIEKYGHWKDTAVRLKGDAVCSFTEMFLEMWNAFSGQQEKEQESILQEKCILGMEQQGYVQPFSDSPLDEKPVGEDIYLNILNQAQDYVYVYTPYLIISDEMQRALVLAAGRGVDVRLITPGIPDKALIYRITRSNYRVLLQGGVRIFEYEPGFVHAKSFVSDDKVAVVGTVNMDFRSLYLHFECGAVLYQMQCISDIRRDFLKTLGVCREVHVWDCREGLLHHLLDAVLRLFSPLA